MLKKLTVAGLLMAGSAAWGGATDNGVRSEVLVQGSNSWDGGSFAYPGGQPQLTVVRIEMDEGETLPWHCHPVPLAGALTRGRLVVSKRNGESTTLEAGDGLIEVSGQWHQGHAEEDLEIIVVYAGSSGQPLTVTEQSSPELTAGCH